MYNYYLCNNEMPSEVFRMCPSGRIYKANKTDPRTVPWGTPQSKVTRVETKLEETTEKLLVYSNILSA